MRYRESKYVLNGINPFDVILGIHNVDNTIGELWDVAGYTPWGMVLGILLNLTFLPELYARYAFLFIYLAVFLLMGIIMYKICRRQYSAEMSLIMALLALLIPGWSTGLNWLNFGALFGACIFLAILLMDDHPMIAGVLLGLAATKPQLAAPFYLGLLVKREFKVLFTAIVIPAIFWIIALRLTSTSLFEMVVQFSDVMNVIGGQLGNWISSFRIFYEIDFYKRSMQLVGALFCIIFAIVIWIFMRKNEEKNNIMFFSVAAILSGMWTYSQAHDRTVLMIVLLCIFQRFGKIKLGPNSWKEKLLLLIFCFSCVMDTSRMARTLAMIIAPGMNPSAFFEFIKYMIWIAILVYLICLNGVEDDSSLNTV